MEYISYDEEYSWTGENTGYTINLTPDTTTTNPPAIKNGALPGEYALGQFHIHWGSSDIGGAEHTVDGVRHFGEIHLVHYNTNYAGISDALADNNGLAVIGFFLEVDEEKEKNGAVDDLIQSMQNELIYKGDQFNFDLSPVGSFKLEDIFGKKLGNFYR